MDAFGRRAKIQRLTREDADRLLKQLSTLWERGPLSQVFLAEYARIEVNEPVWALPEQERMYFIGVAGSARYLFGIRIFPTSIDITSLGKIAEYDPQHSGKSITQNSKSVACLRELIEEHLVTLAGEVNASGQEGKKICIIAFTLPGTDGPSLFEALIRSHRSVPMKGIAAYPRANYEHHELTLPLA